MNRFSLGFALLLLVALAFSGCKKDPEPGPNPELQTCYMKKLTSQFQPNAPWLTLDEVITGAGNRIIRANRYSSFVPDLLLNYTEFEYTAAGNLHKAHEISTDGTPSRYSLFEYNAQNQMVRQDDFVYNDTTSAYEFKNHYTMEYNSANQLVKRISHFGGLGNYSTYEYNTEGNVIREAYFYSPAPGSPPEPGDNYEYEYDDKKAYHTGFSTLKFNAFSLSRNNITKSTARNGNGALEPDQSFNYSYTYNAQGYPTEVSASNFLAPNVSFNSRVEYRCE